MPMSEKSKEVKELEARILQLEESMRRQNMTLPDKPDPSLAEDEWYARFPNWQDTTQGIITKISPKLMSNASALYKVKRIL